MKSFPETLFLGRMRRRIAVLCGLAAFLLAPQPSAGAEKGGRKTVRIAFEAFDRLMEVDERNHPTSGYAYEYTQLIGTYAGWDVEYVNAENFSEGVKKLLAGEVDLFYDVSYTEERAKAILYPDEPMGFEYYYLYASAGNPSVSPGDPSSLDGKTVGITSGTIMTDMLKSWCEKKNVRLEIVDYPSIPEKEADLYAGKIDLDLEISMLSKPALSAVEKIGASEFFLVANKERPDLVDDINSATEKIRGNDLFCFSRLQERYFSDTVLSRNLTRDEKDWLAAHKKLRVGYFDDYLPFSAKDAKGRPIGAGIDAIREIVKELKLEKDLELEFVCFDDQKDGYKAVESGEIDLMFPAYVTPMVKRSYRIVGGKGLATVSSTFAFSDEFEEEGPKRIGVNRHNLMQWYYSKDSYPDAEIVFRDDIRGCLDGLLDGTVDGTFLNGFRAAALLKPGKYHPVRTMQAPNDFRIHMAFAEDNVGLMLLMNRGLSVLDADFVNQASYDYMDRIYEFSIEDFFRDHMLPTTVAIAVLVALLVALAVYLANNRKLARINRELTEYAETVERQRRQLVGKQAELENALKMAQSANRAKTRFLNNVSHDIRTPMNAIIGFTELAERHLGDAKRLKDDLSTIEHSSEHLLSLINDVLDLSRIEAGKMVLHEKAESLPDILRLLRDLVRADVEAKRHEFTVDASGVRNEFVFCDRLRLNRVLLNLVSNAVKYTPPGGKISLRVVQIPSFKAGRSAFEFRVRDNGIGMDEEFVKTIFDPFTREEDSESQGSGLGMTITKSIVQHMGGTISVESKKGEGSEFAVLVDFRLADAPDVPDRPAPEGKTVSLKGKRVLLVDDSEVNLKIGTLVLRAQGMSVDTAANGRLAVDTVREKGAGAYDFVVMDIRMPEMDGHQATAAIRKLPGGDKLKIIAFSANAFEEEREASMKAGMDGYITKPLKIDELLAELGRFAV